MSAQSDRMYLGGVLSVVTVVLTLCTVSPGAAKYTVLHSFGSGTDGGGPSGSVSLDQQGRVYGATSGGGAYNGGIVFRLTHQPNGAWAEKILHSFPSSHDDGGQPNGGLIQDQKGHWYGTTLLAARV